jgi:hypothetical protein
VADAGAAVGRATAEVEGPHVCIAPHLLGIDASYRVSHRAYPPAMCPGEEGQPAHAGELSTVRCGAHRGGEERVVAGKAVAG